jgi:hypothetical protein
MSLLAMSCLIAGLAVAVDAARTERENRRLAVKEGRSLAARLGLPE